MKFELDKATGSNTDLEKEKYEKLGFKYSKYGEYWYNNFPGPTIEISTLEELMEFVREYGKIVLKEGKITIYDTYLE